ncbi:MAG: S24 family peptidase, partial [Saprospiraceae bacterium]
QPTIARILAGKTPDPDVATLMKLGRALGDEMCLIQDNRELDLPSLMPRRDDDIIIDQFDAGGRMGNGGLVLQDQPGVISSWSVTKEWLRLNVKGWSNASRLCIVTGFGDSMRPMFNAGDPLLVDLSIKTVEYDAVYFFRVGKEGFIKRLQRIPGEGLRVLSANRDYYEPWTVKPDMDFEVIGRVLKIWRGDDF